MKTWQINIIFFVALILGIVITTMFFIVGDEMDSRDAEIFQNGTIVGQEMIITWINSTKAVPFFLPDGNVTSITFTQLCEELNKSGGQ